MKTNSLFFVALCAVVMSSCAGKAAVEVTPFGSLGSGEAVTMYHLSNAAGAYVDVIDYGCRVVRIGMPDRSGVIDDVVVGPGDIDGFENGPERFSGPVIGRYGNRIDNASFVIDGVKYDVVANESFLGEPVSCHGGVLGFDRQMWSGEVLEEEGRVGVRFYRLSPDGEEGFPGNMDAYVTYWLTSDNVFKIEYEATTDKPTVVNLSNHTYFNLKGSVGGYVMDHLLTVEADSSIQNNLHFCPDLILPVDGTPFDFREPHTVDYRLDMPSRQLEIMHGMSSCWCIRDYDGTLRKAADLYEPRCGRGVETWTTEPALLTYTGRSFNPERHFFKNGPACKYGAMLLETIHYADSPNQPRFPSTILRPGEKYYSTTEYRFYSK